jgi:putative Mg2+ transporter-C (MgtC) family protein
MSNGDQLEIVTRLLLALALGAVVGLEREYRGHEAGLRTSALVCVGAALFGEVGTLFDESRVAAAVVPGIGFLGAGLIFRRGNTVRNVTTATTMWVLAAIGLAVAESLWLVGMLTVIGLLIVLESAPLSDWVYRVGEGSRERPPD